MKNNFKKYGFFKTKINPQNLSNDIKHDFNIIEDNFSKLNLDPYSLPDSNRYRAYSNLIILPWEREIKWLPINNYQGEFLSSYWQGKFNPEHEDHIRRFNPINPNAKNTKFLNNLIMHDYNLTFWNENDIMYPIYVGIHFVKLLVLDKNHIAYSSPNLMHRDGEAFTFAHLFNCVNLKGGTNYISKTQYANYKLEDIPSEDIIESFEMHETLESYGVCDKMVSHYVSPVNLDDTRYSYGCREIILIDFSPLRQTLE